MAKKITEDSKNENKDDYVGRIARQIESTYGTGIMGDAKSLLDSPKVIIPVSPSIDIITSGGIIEGSWVGITGSPKQGKTSLALTFAANAQKKEWGARPIYYAKIEGRLSRALLMGTKGLILEKPHFNLIQSKSGVILTGQQWLSILVDIIRSVPKAVVIIDSISALCDEREMTEGPGTETRGSGAKLYSQFCRVMNNVVPVNDTIVLGITHLISNTSGMGAQYVERCARMWQYQCDYALRVKSRMDWKGNDGRLIGYQVKWACNVSPLGPPGMSIDSFLRFGVGLDSLQEVISLGIAAGVIKKMGSWFSLQKPDDGAKELKVQGTENLYKELQGDPELASWLSSTVLNMGLQLSGVDS